MIMFLFKLFKKCCSVRIRGILSLLILVSPFFIYYNVINLVLPSNSAVNRYESAIIRPGYEIVPPFSFPVPHVTKPVSEIAAMKWMKDLADNLVHRTSKQIYLQVVNEKYYGAFLNLLVAFNKNTNIDFDQILVVAVDEQVYNALTLRGMSVVLVKPQWVIRHYTVLRLSMWKLSWDVMVLRQTVLRLLNHWGYDVIVIDTDAIPFKDPQVLFENYPHSDIIGSYSLKTVVNFPHRNVWHLCAGVAMYKSTTAVDSLWELVGNLTVIWEDQTNLNDALHLLKPQWSPEGGCDPPSLHCDMTGVTSTGLTITLLSHDLICRRCDLHKRDSYYIWHKFARRTNRRKKETAELGNAWYLRKDWKEIDKNSYSSGANFNNWLKTLKD